MRLFLQVLLSLIVFVFLASCENDSNSSKDLNVNEIVLQQAAFGFEVNEMVLSSREISELTTGTDLLDEQELDTDIFPKVSDLKQQAAELIILAAKKYQLISNKPSLTNSDSLILFQDDTTHGTRLYIGYNTASGIMRLYSVKYGKFFPWQVKTYDSTEIEVDYNQTLEDDSDDKLVRIENLIRYRDTFFIESVLSQIEVTDYDGIEPSGLILTRNSYYNESRLLQHLQQLVEINPDGSGTLREDFSYSDGSTSFNSITFYDNQSGVFSKQFRNGTTVSGEFDSAELDGYGSWSEIIDLPEGRYIVQIRREATVSIIEGWLSANYQQQILFSSGRTDSTSISINSEETNGVTTTNIIARKANGANGTFTITESDDSKEMVGAWTTWNGYFIESEAQWYEDESFHLIYRVYAPPYQAGDPPVMIAEYYFSPDGTADGTLKHDGITYLVKLKDNLKGEISYNGRKSEFDLIQ